MKILQAVKLQSLKSKRLLSKGEFRDLARQTIGKAA